MGGRNLVLARPLEDNINMWGFTFNSGHRVLRVAQAHSKNRKDGEDTNSYFMRKTGRNVRRTELLWI